MTDNKGQNGTERAQLEKSLSPLEIWALALGCILGWGCFVLPGIRFLPEAGPIASFIGFGIGALMLIFVALSYGKMIENYPVAGGAFVYAYAGFGKAAGFLCGWALVLGYLCIIALNGTAIALLSRFLTPGIFEWGFLYSIAGWDIYLGEILLVSGSILLFGMLNYRGAGSAGSAQLFMAFLLIAGVVIFCAAAFATETAAISNLEPFFLENRSAFTCIAAIVAIAPWLYVGFDTIPQAAEEFNFSPDKATRLMIIAIVLGALCYGLVTIAVAVVIPYQELLASKPTWATGTVAKMAMGSIGSTVLAIAVLAAICTGINGFYIATSRLLFSMARSKFLPAWFAQTHPRYGTPHNAIMFSIVMSLIAPWFGREALSWVVDMSAIGTVIAYGFTSMTAYRLMSNMPGISNPERGKVYAVLGAVASLVCLGLLTIPGSPAAIAAPSWYALMVWVVLGVTFYYSKKKELDTMSLAETNFLLLGSKDRMVFFDTGPEIEEEDLVQSEPSV